MIPGPDGSEARLWALALVPHQAANTRSWAGLGSWSKGGLQRTTSSAQGEAGGGGAKGRTAEMLPTPAMYKSRSSFLPDYLRRAL